MTSAPVLPNYLGLPFRILVSPFVHFDPETDGHPDVQLQEPWSPDRRPRDQRQVVGGWSVQHPQHEHRRDLRCGNGPAGRTGAVAKSGTVRPNEFVRPARTVFNLVSSSSGTTKPSRITRGPPHRRQPCSGVLRGRFSFPASGGHRYSTSLGKLSIRRSRFLQDEEARNIWVRVEHQHFLHTHLNK